MVWHTFAFKTGHFLFKLLFEECNATYGRTFDIFSALLFFPKASQFLKEMVLIWCFEEYTCYQTRIIIMRAQETKAKYWEQKISNTNCAIWKSKNIIHGSKNAIFELIKVFLGEGKSAYVHAYLPYMHEAKNKTILIPFANYNASAITVIKKSLNHLCSFKKHSRNA